MSVTRIFLGDDSEDNISYWKTSPKLQYKFQSTSTSKDDSSDSDEKDSTTFTCEYSPPERFLNLVNTNECKTKINRIDLSDTDPTPYKLFNSFPHDYFKPQKSTPSPYLIFILQYSPTDKLCTCQVCQELIPMGTINLSIRNTRITCIHARKDCLNGAGYTSGRMMNHNVCVVSHNRQKVTLTRVEENILGQCGIIKLQSRQQNQMDLRKTNRKVNRGLIQKINKKHLHKKSPHSSNQNSSTNPIPSSNSEIDDLASSDSFSILSINSCSNLSNITDDFQMLDLNDNLQKDLVEEQEVDDGFTLW